MDIDKRSHLLKSGIHDFMQDKSTKLDSNAGYMNVPTSILRNKAIDRSSDTFEILLLLHDKAAPRAR